MGRATLYTSSSRRDPRLYCCTATVARPRYTSSSGCGRLWPHGATHAPLGGCGMLLRRHRSHAGLACHLAELLYVHVTALGGDNACDILQPRHVLHVALNVLRSCSESMWPLSRGRQCYRSPSIFASLCQCISANCGDAPRPFRRSLRKIMLSLNVHHCSPVRESRSPSCGVAQRRCRRFAGRQCCR